VESLADAAIRLGLPFEVAPRALRRLVPGDPIAGPPVPCRHAGSVDLFLEVFETAPRGGILVIDNEGRDDEGCIGDLTVAEARAAGLAGILVWGRHRDDAIVRTLGLPVWSLGTCLSGPRGARPRADDGLIAATVGDVHVTPADVVAADDDGVLFLRAASWDAVATAAAEIVRVEGAQAAAIARGVTLREQLRFAEYLARRADDPAYTFRVHLARMGGAIET